MPTVKIKNFDPIATCSDPEHEPPKYQHFSPGIWEHTCSTCGKKTQFTVIDQANR